MCVPLDLAHKHPQGLPRARDLSLFPGGWVCNSVEEPGMVSNAKHRGS